MSWAGTSSVLRRSLVQDESSFRFLAGRPHERAVGDGGGGRIHLDVQGGISGIQHFDAAVHGRARRQVVDDVVPSSWIVGQIDRDIDEAYADASLAEVRRTWRRRCIGRR